MSITAFIRIKNEEKFIVASIISIAPFVDEVHCIFNNCTDKSEAEVDKLIALGYPIKKFHYNKECARAGDGYIQAVQTNPLMSLADYYNWCISNITTDYALKWDADMICIPQFMIDLKKHASSFDWILLDGMDVLNKESTNHEPRVFKVSGSHYIDSQCYEVLSSIEGNPNTLKYIPKCYLHLKYAKVN